MSHVLYTKSLFQDKYPVSGSVILLPFAGQLAPLLVLKAGTGSYFCPWAT